ncbi:MAG: DNA alkylation repair protein [Muribaculaceae bacterium]|nr:DNA alkylation repair protein [Muribaculaceae bacterium]
MDIINQIHKEFFALRNGLLADAVRKAGCKSPRIFGLNVPQLSEIARRYGRDNELADRLWNEKECRESRLLACWIFDPETVSEEKAMQLAEDVQGVEEADILVFRLLKRLPYAADLLARLETSDAPHAAYTAKMLRSHLYD